MEQESINKTRVQIISDWLTNNGPRCAAPAELLEGFCRKLLEIGLPIDRSTIGSPLLHPIAQSSYVFWDPEKGSNQQWFLWTKESLEVLRASPIYPAYLSGQDTAINLTDAEDRARFPIGAELWEDGFQEYHSLAIPFSDGTNKVLTVATKRVGGFLSDELSDLRSTLPLLALVYEGFISRNAAITLMETYVGKRAGLQVLDGHIARGDGADIDAVIWFSDLRGFTELSRRLDEKEMLDLLNNYLALITEAIEEQGGEVLKYIGDAVLAIFPVGEDAEKAVASAEEAALKALEKGKEQDFNFGIALHRGKVFYGNIGGGSRLDFTVIGSAVNLAARIEGLCSTLGKSLLVSPEFADLSKRKWSSFGEHSLKGIENAVEVFGLENE